MASVESRQAGGGSGGQVAEKAHEAAGQVQEKIGGAADQAKGRLRSEVDTRSTQLGDRIGSTASDMRSVAQQLREQGKEQPAKLAEQAATRAEGVGDYLRHSDGDRIVHDLEDAARQRPWAVVAGGIALGLVASRLLKASSADRYRSRYAGAGTGRSRGALDVGNGYSSNPIGSTRSGAAVS